MEEQTRPGAGRIIRTALVLIILVALPAISVYYLNKGVDYRKKTLSELQDLGKIGGFKLTNHRGQVVNTNVLSGKVSVVQFIPGDAVAARSAFERMAKVHVAFTETDDVLFLSLVNADSTTDLSDFARSVGVKDDKHWFVAGIPGSDRNRLAADVFKIKNPDSGIAVSDTSLTIRKLYDINSNPEMGRLIEHIAILVPKQKRR